MTRRKAPLIHLDVYQTVEELTNVLNQLKNDLEDIEHRPSPVEHKDILDALERVEYAEILTAHIMKARTANER